MTAGQDEARALLAEAIGRRVQIFRDAGFGTYDVSIEDLSDLLGQISSLRAQVAALSAPPPALAPLREAETMRALAGAVDKWRHAVPGSLEYAAASETLRRLCADIAALSRAQPPTTEDLT